MLGFSLWGWRRRRRKIGAIFYGLTRFLLLASGWGVNDKVQKIIDGMGKLGLVNFSGVFSIIIGIVELSCSISCKFLGLLLGLMLIRYGEYVIEGNLGKANFCRGKANFCRVKGCAIKGDKKGELGPTGSSSCESRVYYSLGRERTGVAI